MNVDHLVEQCQNALPQDWKKCPWSHLDHGKAVLCTENQLNAYIAAYGEMHIVKCRTAMQNFPFEDLVIQRNSLTNDIVTVKPYEIFDWGCGQGIGSLVLMQMLHERDMLHRLKRVTLIEPSKPALSRAESWVKQSAHTSNTEIRCINRFIPQNDEPLWQDIECNASVAIHICSNILDIREVGLKWLAQQSSKLASTNIYICVGPLFGMGTSRIADFYNYLGRPKCFTNISKYPLAYTKQTNHPFGIEAKCFTASSQSLNNHYVEESEQTHIDEYEESNDCLNGIISRHVIEAYNMIRTKASGSFEIFLKPAIGVERPDFVLINISNGVLIVNVCSDLSKFAEEFERVENIKNALFDLYIKSLRIDTIFNSSIYNSVKVGLFFPDATPHQVAQARNEYYNNILKHWKKTKEKDKDEDKDEDEDEPTEMPIDRTKYLQEFYNDSDVDAFKKINCQCFKHDFYQEIKDLILGKWHKYSQGDTTLKLTPSQKRLVDDNSDRLRIKGVAGSGKTQIIAYKAVKEQIRTGSKVLIVTYNVTLMQYIKMRINQVPADFPTDAFEIINYHQFFYSKARRYGHHNIVLTDCDNINYFNENFLEIKSNRDQYDTIIIDEAQDFKTSWFDCLRKFFLAENGRMILCGDGEQEIYTDDKEDRDLESRMPRVNGFGSNSPWRQISERVSMRFKNHQIAVLASSFANKHGLSVSKIETQNTLNIFNYHIKYWWREKILKPNVLTQSISEIIKEHNLNLKDIVIIGQSLDYLRAIDSELSKSLNFKTITTFESLENYNKIKDALVGATSRRIQLHAVRRVAKVHFTTDKDAIKLATIQSFKGWESKTIILILQEEDNSLSGVEYKINAKQNTPAHIYTALTRAKENLFIINCGNETYHSFFQDNIS